MYDDMWGVWLFHQRAIMDVLDVVSRVTVMYGTLYCTCSTKDACWWWAWAGTWRAGVGSVDQRQQIVTSGGAVATVVVWYQAHAWSIWLLLLGDMITLALLS